MERQEIRIMSTQVSEKGSLQKFYDDIYTKGDIRDNEKLYCWIIKLFHPLKDRRLLDVGCGSGWLLKEAEKFDLKTYGLDISKIAVERARINAPNSEVLVGDGERLPWPDNYFDYVSCLGSLEHYVNYERGIKEIQRALNSEGTAIIMLPNAYQFGEILKVLFTGGDSEGWQVIERHATKRGWKELLERNGLKVIKIFKYNKYSEFFQKGTLKIKSVRKFFIMSLIHYFSPFNLAQQFIYICRKK